MWHLQLMSAAFKQHSWPASTDRHQMHRVANLRIIPERVRLLMLVWNKKYWRASLFTLRKCLFKFSVYFLKHAHVSYQHLYRTSFISTCTTTLYIQIVYTCKTVIIGSQSSNVRRYVYKQHNFVFNPLHTAHNSVLHVTWHTVESSVHYTMSMTSDAGLCSLMSTALLLKRLRAIQFFIKYIFNDRNARKFYW